MKRKTVIYLLFMLVLLMACSTKRHSGTASRQTVLTERVEQDSLIMQQLHLEQLQRNTTVRHIRLTRPDSLGRQAVQSVVEIRMEETNNVRDTMVQQLVHRQSQQEIKEDESRTETIKTVERKSRVWGSLLWVATLLGLIAVFFRKRGRFF